MSKITPNELTLDRYLLISNGELYVPYTQRPYTWEKSNVKRLFDDFIVLYENRGSDKIHMLNFITLYEEEGKKYIYDGQQRTLTILLILSNLIKMIIEKATDPETEKYVDYAKELKREYIVRIEPLNPNNKRWKIVFDNIDANGAFENIVLDNYLSEELSVDYTQKLISNNKYIHDLVKNFTNNLDLKDICLFIDTLLKKTYLIQIITDSEEIANSMFESLNNTGQKVEHYYVLKNLFVEKLGETSTKCEWDNIDSALNGLDKSEFLSAVATIYNGKTNRNNLLEVLKQNISTKETTEIFLKNITDLARYFAYIKNPISKTGTDDPTTNYHKLMKDISIFKFTQHSSLILAMFIKGFLQEEINLVLKEIRSIVVKNIFIAKIQANEVEILFADLAKETFSSNNTNEYVSKLIKKLQSIIIADDKIEYNLMRREFISSQDKKGLKYILREIYNVENNFEILIPDVQDIWLEHILPQAPEDKSYWEVLFGKIRNDEGEINPNIIRYIYGIGNATLLLNAINRDASNKEFVDKKRIYLDSNIPQNKVIAENKDWSPQIIDTRTAILIKKINELW